MTDAHDPLAHYHAHMFAGHATCTCPRLSCGGIHHRTFAQDCPEHGHDEHGRLAPAMSWSVKPCPIE